MRRFIVGYYPLRVKLEVRYPPSLLAVQRTSQKAQPGFAVTSGDDLRKLDANFEGKLLMVIEFVRRVGVRATLLQGGSFTASYDRQVTDANNTL